ncbi:unnamed protein product [Prunus brigantina]
MMTGCRRQLSCQMMTGCRRHRFCQMMTGYLAWGFEVFEPPINFAWLLPFGKAFGGQTRKSCAHGLGPRYIRSSSSEGAILRVPIASAQPLPFGKGGLSKFWGWAFRARSIDVRVFIRTHNSPTMQILSYTAEGCCRRALKKGENDIIFLCRFPQTAPNC